VRIEAADLDADARGIAGREADIGIVTCGKAHYDLLEAFRRLGLGLDELDAAGIRLPATAPLLHFSTRQDMLAWAPETLESIEPS
jgi:TPP-dependent indolepyruvate ferredoxin oxidoreductase alpha subunit